MARLVSLAVLATAAVLSSGCGGKPGINWRFTSYEDGLVQAEREKKLTFVYFRDWYSAECARFEEEVLKDSQVRGLTNDMVSIPLEFFWVRTLAREFSIRKVPGWAVVTPAGKLLVRGEGYTSVAEVLAALRAAQEDFRRSQGARPAG